MTQQARVARAALALALGWLLAFGPAARPASAQADLAAIDAYLTGQMEELRIPGLALGIVRGDEIIALKGYGVAGSDGTPVTPQTAFSIGSLTKSFTALAIMQQVEAGRLELDAPVQRYLPWFRVADPAASASITVRQLLNNASGLPRDFDPLAPHAVDQTPETLEARLRSLSEAELEGPVGAYAYSNAGYQALAMLLQQAAGQPYGDYVRERIFAPLGMGHSFASLGEAAGRPVAEGHHYWFGWPVAAGAPPYRTGPGNGGLFASAEDLCRYLIAQLNQGRLGGAALLSPAGMAELHRPAVARPDGARYAMGWSVREAGGGTIIGHSGQTYNYFAKMVFAPPAKGDPGWGVVVLQNSQPMLRLISGDQRQDALADGVLSLLLGESPQPPPAGPAPALVYGVIALPLAIQLGGMARSIRRLRRRAVKLGEGVGRAARLAGPLGLNLAWAALALLGAPLALGGWAKAAHQMPDLTWILAGSGALALAWAAVRTIWAWRTAPR